MVQEMWRENGGRSTLNVSIRFEFARTTGRERTYFEHFWNNFAADKTRSLSESDRKVYTAAYARPDRMAAGWAYFVSFQGTAREFAQLAQKKLTIPVLSIGGDKANGAVLAKQAATITDQSKSVTLPNAGHWIMEERPAETMQELLRFLSPAFASGIGQFRMAPDEVRANQTGSEQIGSSLVPGVTTKVLFGDPSKPGFYAIVLSVPANTTIAAHAHRDDRIATVVSGIWQFGYGDRFDESALKSLPPGSVYSEPAGTNHFARTGEQPVLVQISGFGPTDTQYVRTANLQGGEFEKRARGTRDAPR